MKKKDLKTLKPSGREYLQLTGGGGAVSMDTPSILSKNFNALGLAAVLSLSSPLSVQAEDTPPVPQRTPVDTRLEVQDGDTNSAVENVLFENFNNENINGGAINNLGTIGDTEKGIINAEFKNNTITGTNTTSSRDSKSYGGAIYNKGTISEISGIFENNTVRSSSEISSTYNNYAYGGAIYNEGSINKISGHFTGNMAIADKKTGYSYGGAVYSSKYLNELSGIFDNNTVSAVGPSYVYGGAAYLSGGVDNISADFTNNKAEIISGSGSGSYARAYGGALYLYSGTYNVSSDFTNNSIVVGSDKQSVNAYGGAVYNYGTFNADGNLFEGNSITASSLQSSVAASGGAVYSDWGTMNISNAQFNNNKISITGNGTAKGGAVYAAAYSGTSITNTDFKNNSVEVDDGKSNGGALYVGRTTTLTDTSFENNTAISKSGTAQGGAIYNNSALNIISKDKDVVFSGNKSGSDIYNLVSDGIYNNGTLCLNAGEHKIILNDRIIGYKPYSSSYSSKININQEITNNSSIPEDTPFNGTIIFNNTVTDSSVNIYNGTLKLNEKALSLSPDDYFQNSEINMYGGTLDTANGIIDFIKLTNIHFDPNSKLYFDVNLETSESDNFTILGNANGILKLSSFNIIKDGNANRFVLFNNENAPDLVYNKSYTPNGSYVFIPDKDQKGAFFVSKSEGQYTLTDMISDDSVPNRSYSLQGNEKIAGGPVAMGGIDSEAVIFGNSYEIDGDGYEGIIVSEGQTLEIKDVLNWSNHKGSILKNKGTLKVSNSNFSDNQSSLNYVNNETLTSDNSSKTSLSAEGVIKNEGTLEQVNGNFINNQINLNGNINLVYDGSSSSPRYSLDAFAMGGAIYNTGKINDIVGRFENNKLNVNLDVSYDNIYEIEAAAQGGAIYLNQENRDNPNTPINIHGDFIGNSVNVTSKVPDGIGHKLYAQGGAVYAVNTNIKSITGSFVSNSATAETNINMKNGWSREKRSEGGAIYFYSWWSGEDASVLDNISAKFLKNSAENGGAVYNGSRMNITDSLFEENTSVNGALYNTRILSVKDTDFISNIAKDAGGAFYNLSAANVSDSAFKNNSAKRGGAIYNWTDNRSVYSEYDFLELNNVKFENNISVTEDEPAGGGAIYNDEGNITNIKGSFINNTASSSGSSAEAFGGAVYHNFDSYYGGKISLIEESAFNGNKAESVSQAEHAVSMGGALYLSYGLERNSGGYKTAYRSTDIANTDFTGNSVTAQSDSGTAAALGGAVFVGGGNHLSDQKNVLSFIDSSFTDNKAVASSVSGSATAAGGAIYNQAGVINLIASGKDIVFSGNTANGVSNAIHMQGDRKDDYNDSYVKVPYYYLAQLNVNGTKKVVFNDRITSTNNYDFNITKYNQININASHDKESTVKENSGTSASLILNADMSGFTGEINQYDGTVKVGAEGSFFGSASNLVDYNFEGGVLDLKNNKIDTVNLVEFSSTDNSFIMIDADMDNGISDNFNAHEVTAGSKLTVKSVNILKDGYERELTLFNGGIAPELTGTSVTYTNTSKYTFTPSSTAGVLDVAHETGYYHLYEAVKDNNKYRTYSMSTAEEVDKHLTDMLGGDNAELTVAANNNNINGNNYEGIYVNPTQALVIQNIGAVDENGTVVTSWNGQSSQNGGVVNNSGSLVVSSAVLSGNKASQNGGAINNSGNAEVENTAFIGNHSENSGGALYNDGTISLTDADFINNSAGAQNNMLRRSRILNYPSGGAITNDGGNMIITASSKDIEFSGNMVNGTANDIHMESLVDDTNPDNSKIASLTFTGPKAVNIRGGISGSGKILKDGIGVLNLGGTNENFNGDVELKQGSIHLMADSSYFNAANTLLNADTNLNLINSQINNINLGNLTLNGKANIGIDVDLQKQESDFVTAGSVVSNSGVININSLNIISDSSAKDIYIPAIDTANDLSTFAQLDPSQSVAYGPIYKYGIAYDKTTGELYFNGNDTPQPGPGPSPTPAGGFNPAILTSSVAQQGAYLSMLNNYVEAFGNMDMLMLMPKQQRTAYLNKNKYAVADGGLVFTPTMLPEDERGVWFRPYSTFESVNLKSGPDVNNVMYGSLFGVDSAITETKGGFLKVLTGYAGYTGSHQTFQGNSIYQNGGLIGGTAVFYKGNFFSGLTANVGALQASASTMYGSDDFTMLTAGIASKSGYNFSFLDEKLILQPNYMMSYTFVNTFDYTNKAGVRLTQDPLNAIQIAPGIKLIGNLKNGWQPYLGVTMVWNIIDKTNFKANDVSLPEMSVKPYVAYGAGVQKRWGDRFTGYLQAMLRNGGRNGIGFSAGFRWTI